MKYFLLAGAALAVFATLAQAESSAPSAGEATRMGPWGYDLSGRDLAAKPGDDFFQYSNGAWAARTQIPADHTRFGNFDLLRDLSEARVRGILEDASAGKLRREEDTTKLAAAWRSFMNEERVEQLDMVPLAPALKAVLEVKTHDDMTRLMGRSVVGNYKSFFGLSVRDDAREPQRYAIYLSASGLGLPDRDYYLQSSFAAKKAAYEVYVRQLLDFVLWPDAAAAAKAVVDMETRVAQASWTRAQQRDPEQSYHAMAPAELQVFAPGLDWAQFLAQARLLAPQRVVLTTDSATPKLAAIFAETPLSTLKAWQAFHVMDGAAPLLSRRFADANFALRSATLAGQPEQSARWKRAVVFVNGAMGEAVGRVYVSRHFPGQSKAAMEALVANIREALRQRIEKLDWMGAQTKVQALEKLSKFSVKIAYPERWRSYSTLQMADNDLYGNSLRSKAFAWQRVVDRLHKPVDKAEWNMTPQTVNASYNPQRNDITFPAAILQPPFFDPQADPAINYGGIGGVIGHEVSHGFDDEGRKSDGDGLLRDWWAAQDATKFKVQADKLGAQYSSYEPVAGSRVNGALTMGENIGDLGGLSLALDAYRLSLQGRPSPVLDGTSGQQRVFMGWAQVWRAKIRDEAQRRQLVSDPHSPAQYRVNGVVRNMDAWYEAFDVKPGDKLYLAPAERVRIW